MRFSARILVSLLGAGCATERVDHSAQKCSDVRFAAEEFDEYTDDDTGLSEQECFDLCYSMAVVSSCGNVRVEDDLVLLECCGEEDWL